MDFAPKVKDATEAIQQFPPLVDAILNILSTPAGWVVLAALFLWLLVNKNFVHLFDIFERKERRRFEYLDLYIAKPELADAEALKVLRDFRDAHYFKVATRIDAKGKFRSALIVLHERTSHIVSWGLIRRAIPYIEVDQDGKVSIRERTTFETIGYRYNQLVGYVSLLAAAGIFSLFIFTNGKTLAALVWGVGGSFGVVFFAIFVFAQNWPVHAATCIKMELSRSSKRTNKAPKPSPV